MSKYITRPVEAFQAAVNQLALDTMLPIYADYLDLDDEQLAKRNAFAAIYNDGIRCFAEHLNCRLAEEAENQE